MAFRATNFEFRQRFFIIGAIFWGSFTLYSLDRVSAGAVLGNWLAARLALNGNHVIRAVFVFGATLSILSATIRTWASSYLHSAVVHDRDLHSNKLVGEGPYRYVRNPLYLGTTLLSVGMGLMASRAGFALLVIGNLVFTYRLIFREESELIASQGESYRNYLTAVPRLWPSVSPRVPSGGGHPQWGQAFLGEGFFWIFAGANVLFAITLSLKFWYVPMMLALSFYFLAVYLIKRRASKPEASQTLG